MILIKEPCNKNEIDKAKSSLNIAYENFKTSKVNSFKIFRRSGI